VAAAEALGVKQEAMAAGLASFRPAFGRQEEVNFRGKKVKILLSKNPAGFNEALRAVKESEQKGPLLLVLNDRVPDGRDVSWIYDVDFEELQNYPFPIFAAGDRAYDLGLRLKYGEVGGVGVCEGLKEGVLKAVGETGERETLWILPTYSAMLEVRKVLTGRGISED
jgi:UDP-N-acetylmuramyl tripeptide synthase